MIFGKANVAGQMSAENEFEPMIQNAVRLHGHLGPFLVIGVRMGILAKKKLKASHDVQGSLSAVVRVPAIVPFSCTIDGIQTATSCTVGNKRLMIEHSREKIAASFISEQGGIERKVDVSVDQNLVKKLIEKQSKGVSNEELAAEVASMAESEIFKLEKP